MTQELTKEQLKPEHPDRKTGYERIFTDPPHPWFVEIYPGGDGEGYLRKLKRHAITLHQRSMKRLIISFDNIAVVNDLSFAREPWGWRFYRDKGWSHMGIFARNKAWYRDREIMEFLEKEAKAGFFKQFDQVVLTGSSMGGFAALVFAPLVPGATVIAFNPQTTLDERLIPWETRYQFGRVQDWDLPYGDAATAIKDIGRAYVFYDPFFEPDRKHAERLAGKNTISCKTWFSNHFAAPMLRKLDLLKPVMSDAMDHDLDAAGFHSAFRARRLLPWYMRGLTEHNETRHPQLLAKARHRFRVLRRARIQKQRAADEQAAQEAARAGAADQDTKTS